MAQKYIDSPAFHPLLERDLIASSLLPLTERSILSRQDPVGYHAALMLIASRLAERMPESMIAGRAFFGAMRWFFRQHTYSLLSPATNDKADDSLVKKKGALDKEASIIGCCTPLNLLTTYFPRRSKAARYIYHDEPYFGRFLRRRATHAVHSTGYILLFQHVCVCVFIIIDCRQHCCLQRPPPPPPPTMQARIDSLMIIRSAWQPRRHSSGMRSTRMQQGGFFVLTGPPSALSQGMRVKER